MPEEIQAVLRDSMALEKQELRRVAIAKKSAKPRTSKHGTFRHGQWKGADDDGYGPFGRPREASYFTQVRLKRYYKKAGWKTNNQFLKYIEVQKKNGDGKWVSLGCFDTENEAVGILEDEIEMMKLAELLKEIYFYYKEGNANS